jgi:alcohol dehydrogenase
MMQLIQQGLLQPQRLVERTIGLDEAAALLPRFDHSPVAGMTIVDPSR